MTFKLTPLSILREGVFYGVLTLVGIIMLLPFLWALSTSLKLNQEIFTLPIRWVPSQITLEHYRAAFSTIPYGRYFFNSMLLAVAGVVSNLFLGSLAGYAFARMRFRGRQSLFKVLMASMMIPGAVTLVPAFVILRSIPLVGGNGWQGEGGHGPVSYTHLRAHETVLDLVCRLLLEKKKNILTIHTEHYIQTNHTHNIVTMAT